MADFTQIIQEINNDINTNGVGAITGAKLNEVLRDMIAAVNAEKQDPLTIDAAPTEDSTNPVQSGGVFTALNNLYNALAVAGNCLFGGFVEPDDEPFYGDDHRYYYLAATEGRYTHFYNFEVDSYIAMFLWNENTQHWRMLTLWPNDQTITNWLQNKANIVYGATQGNLAGLDEYGNPTDSGKSPSDFATAAQGTKADTAYQKPSGGIPKTDLASGVQTSLGKADTAFQKPSGGIPASDLAAAVQTSLGKADTAVQQVTVGTTTTGNAGTNASVTNSGTATAPVLDFTIPRGADGQDGADAVNPFKGWFDSSSALTTAHPTPLVGDFAYVHDVSPATTVSIYRCATEGTWADSGDDVDTSLVQTFQTGEQLNQVGIDYIPTANSTNLVKSGGVANLVTENRDVDISGIYDGTFNGYISSNNKIYSSGSKTLRYKLMTETITFSYQMYGNYSGVCKMSVVPIGSADVDTVYSMTAAANVGGSGTETIEAGKYLVWTQENVIIKHEIKLKDVVDNNIIQNTLESVELKDSKSLVVADCGTPIGWYKNLSTEITSVSSSTQDTITLPDSYSHFSTDVVLAAVKHEDGSCSIHLFSQNGNVLTIIRRGYDDNISLSDVEKIQGCFDTAQGGNGQHLSAFGYLGLANYILSAVKKEDAILQDNYIGGYLFSLYGNNSENKIGWVLDSNGNVVVKPIYRNAQTYGGYKANTIQSDVYNKIKDCFIKHYLFYQTTEGASVEFPINNSKMLSNGYIVVRGGLYNTSSGSVRVDVMEDGISVYNGNIGSVKLTKLVFDGIDLSKKISVKFTCQTSTTYLAIHSVLLYSKPVTKTAITEFLPSDKIAVIGDSWTQYPLSNQPVENDSSFNTIDVLANGETAGGYCYLPKEIARLTGCTVDNYGKKDMTSVYGLQQLAQNILAQGKHYDYIIFEYYINDYNNQSISSKDWKENLSQFVAVAKSMNAKPILLLPTSTNSEGQSTNIMTYWYSLLLNGFNL